MIRLSRKWENTLVLSGEFEDRVDLQDLVYRLQCDGYVTDFGSNLKIKEQKWGTYAYAFANELEVKKFKKAYKEHMAKIREEKKWRQNI